MKQKTIFYEKVKELVKKQKPPTTIKAVVEEAGLDYDSYYSCRKKGNSPRVDEAVKIAKILGVSVEQLATGKEPNFAEDSIKAENDLCQRLDNLKDDINHLLNNFVETINYHKEKFE